MRSDQAQLGSERVPQPSRSSLSRVELKQLSSQGPPSRSTLFLGPTTKSPLTLRSAGFVITRQRPTFPQPHGGSSMGPGGLNFRVRDGNGWNPSGMATGNSEQGKSKKA